MAKSALVITMITVTWLMSGCASKGQNPTQVASNLIQRQSIIPTTDEKYPAKNPQSVAFFTQDKAPHAPYRVIGVATVSKFNLLGNERQHDTLNDMMKKLAASIGGDGVIDVNTNNDAMRARVIAFQRILI